MINDGFQTDETKQLLKAVIVKKVDFVKFRRISIASLFNSEKHSFWEETGKYSLFHKDLFLGLSPADKVIDLRWVNNISEYFSGA